MDLRDYVRLLRRRWRLIVLCTFLALAAATAVTLTQSKIYTAQAQLFVSAQDGGAGASINNAYTGGLFTQQRVKSYVSVMTSLRTADLIKTDTGLPLTADAIAKKISASAPLDTVLLDVSVKDHDPRTAQLIANSLGKVFPGVVADLERPTTGGASPVKVTMVQPADLPGSPTSPRPNLNLALGLLVGLAVGVGGAVLRETLDTSVKGVEEATELIGAPVLGTINYDAEAGKKPLMVVASPDSVMAEAFRQLRTNLQFVDIEHPLRSVVFTSSIPGEGKTTTTCNLAIALDQAGLRVVLVEADLRRPRIADYLGIEGAVGLTSVLLGRVALDDALQPWGEGGLQVLASGPLPPNPSELLGSAGMRDLLSALQDRADIVILDAPPLLPVTDAAVLGAFSSGVVMVVHSHATRREQVTRATATIASVGATMLGVVLNMVPTKGPDAHGYGYEYGYASKSGTGRLTRGESVVLGAARRGRQSSEQAPPSSATASERDPRRVAAPAGDVLPTGAAPADASTPESATGQEPSQQSVRHASPLGASSRDV